MHEKIHIENIRVALILKGKFYLSFLIFIRAHD